MRRARKLAIALSIGVAAALLLVLVSRTAAIAELEHLTWDLRAQLFADEPPDDTPIRIIAIDDESIRWMDDELAVSWPWSRAMYRYILEFCRASGARAIAFDMFFTETNLAVEGDRIFGEAIDATPRYIGALLAGERWSRRAWPDDVPPPPWRIEIVDGAEPNALRPTAEFDVPEIARATRWRGHVDATPDRDGVIRRVTPFVTFDGRVIPLLGLATSAMPPGGDASAPFEPDLMRIDRGAVDVGAHRLPVDSSGRMIVRFRRPSRDGWIFPTISARSVLNAQARLENGETPDLPLDTFVDAYVLVGVTASALFDHWPSPLKPLQSGVEFHANVLDNVLTDSFMRDAPGAAVVSFMIGICVLGAFLVLASSTGKQTALLFLTVLQVPWLVGFGAYGLGVWWPVAAPQLALLLSMLAALVTSYATEGRQRRFIRQAFRHYLHERVIDLVLEDPSRLSLGGERRELTIMFTDLQRFSTIAEALDAQEIGRLLNDYLTDMTEIILEEDGTIDKYAGDAIVAFWNAPTDQPDHAQRACRAAVRCQRRLAERQADYRERAGADLVMRIGVHSGEVGVGNFGSHYRFDYTVIGHAANLASRLEGANKHLGTRTIVSEATWARLGAPRPAGREIGLVRVVGVEAPVRVHELLDDDAPAPDDAFRRALELLRARNYADACTLFERWPADPVAVRYVKRLRAMTPDDVWDGVWDLEAK